ncbi:uncharacterized protein LODBEIA_P54030 [Lodderomyces beijingensis]|uniref:Uncharacterized protein n=1 Tax=Lodderomyces beijingensis TaxID=1775926 RepID=A0ABP0ZTF7_9ASCO
MLTNVTARPQLNACMVKSETKDNSLVPQSNSESESVKQRHREVDKCLDEDELRHEPWQEPHPLSTTTTLSLELPTWPQIKRLQRYYYNIYKQLTQKLNHLIYLTKLQELSSAPTTASLANRITEIQKDMSVPSSLPQLYEFLYLANQETKTADLLNRYLMLVNPIQKAIHYAELNTPESQILHYLNQLYDGDESLVSKLQEIKLKQRRGEMPLYPYESSHETKREKQQIRDLIREIRGLNNSIADLEPQAQAKSARYKSELRSSWSEMDRLCLLIIGLISSLPFQWYDAAVDGGGAMAQILVELNGLRRKLEAYQEDIVDVDVDKLLRE